MYDLFNILAWIWIAALGTIVVLGVCTTLYRMLLVGYPRSTALRWATFGQLYGKSWLIPVLASIVALTVDFDPNLQWWVVVTSAAFIILRFINILAIKAANP